MSIGQAVQPFLPMAGKRQHGDQLVQQRALVKLQVLHQARQQYQLQT